MTNKEPNLEGFLIDLAVDSFVAPDQKQFADSNLDRTIHTIAFVTQDNYKEIICAY